MTEAQIEAVARAYCRRMGLDPDEWLLSTGGGVPGNRWQACRQQAREAIAMREALEEVLK